MILIPNPTALYLRGWSFAIKILIAMLIGICMAFTGYASAQTQKEFTPIPTVVTADIQAGIEKHIDDQSRLNDGYFKLPFENKNLRLKLVRVHVEYLANLGPRYHFACVDLASTEGDVYDVDFFLKGDPGDMTVTETTVHKINGQPIYAWEQKDDRTWHRVPMDDASQHLLGVITDQDEFIFLYQIRLPEIIGNANMWIPVPVTDAFQTVETISVNVPGKQSILDELEHGNKILFLELGPKDSHKQIEIRYQVKRFEKSAYVEKASTPDKYLKPERLVPMNENFRNIANEVLAGKKGDLVRARALYDHVIDHMCYKKFGSGWGLGDAVYACDVRTGNCTDFHSYFIALSRAAGIPARFAIGAGIPSARNEGGISGYHCWAEFYAEEKWWPVDISEGDKYSSLATYYFGHHPANRIELSRGRDLTVEPGPASGPINFFAYPVFEMDGKPIKLKPKFSFVRNRK
jgi:transglutaminase-like putative cysteine protease